MKFQCLEKVVLLSPEKYWCHFGHYLPKGSIGCVEDAYKSQATGEEIYEVVFEVVFGHEMTLIRGADLQGTV